MRGRCFLDHHGIHEKQYGDAGVRDGGTAFISLDAEQSLRFSQDVLKAGVGAQPSFRIEGKAAVDGPSSGWSMRSSRQYFSNLAVV